MSKILFPLLEKTKSGYFWNDGYKSDFVPNLLSTDDPYEKTHLVNIFKNKDGNFIWTIFDDPMVIENIKQYKINSAYVVEDNGEVSIAIFNKDDIKIL